jgi:gas vesicle protein
MTHHHQDTNNSSSFITGFTVGLFAGAAGYFLFGTKEGAKVRKQLVEDWEEAKEHLVEEGVLEHPEISLREFFRNVIDQAVNRTEEIEERLLPDEDGRRSKTASARKKDSKKRFKGV